jgi:alpha/beta superfamily hydrolase
MGATDYKQPMVEPFQLDKMPMPVLDLYGFNDYPAVLRMAPERLEMIERAGNPKSQQLAVPGADHYFKGQNEALITAIQSWLDLL